MTLSLSPLTVETPLPLGFRGGVEHLRGFWQTQPVFMKAMGGSDQEQLERFSHEGRINGRLSHPLLVPLLAGTERQLVFPFVQGCTLRELIETGPISPGQAVRVLDGLLQVVGYLHGEGVTHHDLKPENVMLDGHRLDAGAVRLIDLGMAHDRQAGNDTHAGTRMGTPHFMAPEQFQGVRGDPRSDLYALGVLFWDALAGQPPYADPLGWLLGMPAVRAPLPQPTALQPLLERCLHRDPADRFQNAGEMLIALRAATLLQAR
ncbi:serine/threonine-protein kinase [Deinococcus sp.]|uniref:serine/threonine-protein kinase n=1 Tax=Deinococcus sp. TaxID=47478 RepID=UPI003C7B6AAC